LEESEIADAWWECDFNPVKAELNPICNLLALLGAHHIFHISGLRVNQKQKLIQTATLTPLPAYRKGGQCGGLDKFLLVG